MEIAGDIIIEPMKNAIKAAFPQATVYMEKAIQNMQRPCFFIRPLSITSATAMRGSSVRDYNMVVRYHPDDRMSSKYVEMQEIANSLMGLLRQITLADKLPVRAGSMRFEIVDQVLHFTVSYRIRTEIKKTQAPDMGALFEKIHVRSVM